MTLHVTPFVPSDYVRILEAAQIDTPWIEDRLAHGRVYASGPSYTIWAGAEIACTLGLVIHWRGRAYAWAVWGPAGYRHALGVHRLTVRYLAALRDRYRLLRIDADIVHGFTAGARWAVHLGFVPRGEPDPYAGPQGETMQRWVWLHPHAAALAPEWLARCEPVSDIPPVHRPDGTLMPAIRGGTGLEIIAIVAVVATVAAGAMAAYSSYEQGQAQKKAYKYNAKVAQNQAEIAKQQQEFAARQQRERDRRLRATARAAQGVSGVEVGEGSSLLVDIENARTAEMNAAAARYTGQAQQTNLLAGSLLSSYQGDVAARQGTLGAIAGGISTVGSAAGAYSRYSSKPTGVQVPTTTPGTPTYAYP
jgi:Tfp pilus assembly protein PilE